MTDLASVDRRAALDGFGALAPQAPDALLGLIALYRDDSRAEKIDLGVGVFRDDAGLTPVMRAVKAAEAILLREQESKSYLGPEGDIGYAELLADVALGRELARSPRIVGVQTPGGTGALRLGAELLRRALPGASIWIGSPTWPNHAPIFQEAGLQARAHRFYDVASAQIDLAAMLEDLEAAAEGDVLLLHGCCHNPTGASLSTEQWQSITDVCAVKGIIPFIDLAYQGLGDGLDEDAWASRALFEALPNALLAYSCDKNFGLYRERVGALWVQSACAEQSEPVRGNMLALARSIWSMPPDHGAAIVRTILERDDLRNDWMAELAEMRNRINMLRQMVAQSHPGLAFIGAQRGMFAMLPIDKNAVTSLRAEQGIYMAGNGRINIAGLSKQNMSNFVAGLAPHL
ncbi:aromatic amino acid aminotransferase apoenzyme [Sphingobium sp. AP50]|uniref:amino acid aminotransferase n=1 Tax=Sphingobium sp. AP50 TaxID=1884369 RepID=UPI0008B7C2A8|nr:amino acid aminotransferase [Sphingobium sp. AP50]SEJ73815.1 aromatic amino acid aminotransferase apoenzyme [Sphingobium sp. AP50]